MIPTWNIYEHHCAKKCICNRLNSITCLSVFCFSQTSVIVSNVSMSVFVFYDSGGYALRRSCVTLQLVTQLTVCLSVCGKRICGSCNSSARLSISEIAQVETTGTTRYLPQWSPAPPARSTSTSPHPPLLPNPRAITRVVLAVGRHL